MTTHAAAAGVSAVSVYDMVAEGKLSPDEGAKLLMEQRGLNEDAAYKLLRKLAMDQNKRIGEVAQDIVTYAKVLKK